MRTHLIAQPCAIHDPRPTQMAGLDSALSRIHSFISRQLPDSRRPARYELPSKHHPWASPQRAHS